MALIPDLRPAALHSPDGFASRAADPAITGITADSRAVLPGMIFAALPSASKEGASKEGAARDGRDFIADAVAKGAAAILAPEGTLWPAGVPPRPLLAERNPRRRLAQIAAVLAGRQPETIVAVTGTNGKTSTADFLRQIFARAGKKSASLGTLGLIAEGFPRGESLTTPDPVTLANQLASLARAGVSHVALEASSHGLDQCRLDGVRLAGAAFTNLTRDHLDYHGTLEAYTDAKLRLFETLLPKGAPACAMADMDPTVLDLLRAIARAKKLDLRLVGRGGDALALIAATPLPDGQELVVSVRGAARVLRLDLPGGFQADNALLAACLADALGIPGALDSLPHLAPVRGRLERAAVLPNGSAAYVDYAHTPDALERLIAALRPHARGKLILVFGAGGDRDRGKRPLMGTIARQADIAIVTDDNPRSEDPAAIRAAILAAHPDALEIADRRAAIEAGLNLLGPGDVLAVAGKGHEQGQIVAGEILPFDDAAVIRELL